MLLLVILAGLGSALLMAVGFVVQQHTAEQAPSSERLRPKLLLDLLRRPIWILGIATMVVGQLLGALALDHGTLTLVEPLMAANVLFALPLAAAWHRKRLGRREWVGAVVLIAGLGVFVVAANPGSARRVQVGTDAWLTALLGVAAIVGVAIVVSRRFRNAARQATLIAVGAGALYGLQDALTQRTLELGMTPANLFGSWQPYLLVATAVVGLLLAQSAYQAAPIWASQPAMAATEPVTGIALGAGLFAQGLRLSVVPLAFEIAGIAAMIAGIVLVAGSAVVTAPASAT